MNLVDVILLVALAGALVHGIFLGAAVQVLSFGGFWGGLALGALLAPSVGGLSDDPVTKAFLSIMTVFGVAILLAGVGRVVGTRVWRALRQIRLGWVDSGLGAVVAVVSTLLVAWLVASMLATTGLDNVAGEVQGSKILRTLDRHLPNAPTLFSRVQRLFAAKGIPSPFAGFEPGPASRLPLPADPQVRAAVAAAGAATVKIEGAGCGGVLEGSGFVAAPGLVVTNAHVVAGVDRPFVLDRAGRHAAVPVVFDPNMDVAVLRVGGLDAGPLAMLPTTVDRGVSGAVLGYPGGGPFDAEAAVVLNHYVAVGRDIYGRGITRRDIYEIRSDVRPGNSGGPLVRTDGTVVGVVFSRSVRNGDIGYTLTSAEVRPEVAAAQARQSPVDTGSCAAA